MPIPLPNLDDRRWVDLVEEGRALIPFYGPEWTDHNYHCPGITFIELLAWITEMDVYQVNRVPDSHVRKFLALVGARLLPPSPARAVVGMRLKESDQQVLSLPKGFEFVGNNSAGNNVPFRTLAPLIVSPRMLKAIQIEGRAGFQDVTERWKRREPLLVFGEDPQPGAAIYFGFELPVDRDFPITLYVQIGNHRWSLDERRRILSAAHEGEAECAAAPPLLSCVNEPAVPSVPEKVLLRHHSVLTVWEVLDAAGQWRSLDSMLGKVTDSTRAFTLNGPIQIAFSRATRSKAIGRVAQAYHYMRCRLMAGAYDAAPIVKDVVVNGVLVEQAVQTNPVSQKGSGRPYQSLQCPNSPVVESTVNVSTVGTSGKSEEWERVADLDASRAPDRHYIIDATRGIVLFGDGQRGMVPGPDEKISVSSSMTSAEAGNVFADTITEIGSSQHDKANTQDPSIRDRLTGIHNRFPSDGGRAGETLAEALARIFLDLEQTPRAVTLDDFKRLSVETPGTRIARAFAWANVHPASPCLKAPGLITVVILPFLPVARPFPSRGLREAVSRYLRSRRIVTTRVEVTGPTYTEVRVRAKVQSRLGVNKRDLVTRLTAAVDAFLHPLTGGPDKTGWPFGRDVYRSEVLQLFDETSGVDHVLELEFVDGQGRVVCGNFCLGQFGVVAAGTHSIEIV
jgi:predicted phage baseplate assembly protein